MRACTACGSVVFPGASDCPRCGRMLDGGTTTESEAPLIASAVRTWPFKADRVLPIYALRACFIALIPSMALGAAAFWMARLVGLDPALPPEATGWTGFVGAVFIAPALETLLLVAGIHLIARFMRQWAGIALVSAVAWGLLHGLVAPIWFFGTVWSFFVFSSAYLAWRPVSAKSAFLAAALPHALLNAILTSTIYLVS